MEKPKNTLRIVSWLAVGLCCLLVLTGAVILVVETQGEDEVGESKASAGPERRGARRRRPYRPMRPMAVPTRPRPSRAKAGLATKAKADKFNRAMRAPPKSLRRPDYRPRTGRLSQEELEKRRTERRQRQIDRLQNRIKTLGERIEQYRSDGTRTEPQIKRMERSLERMRKRLERLQGQNR